MPVLTFQLSSTQAWDRLPRYSVQLLPFPSMPQKLYSAQVPQEHHTLYELFIALTLLRPGVVFAKSIVFGYIWVQKSQWIFWNVFSCHHFVVANDIREGNSRELLLGVRFY